MIRAHRAPSRVDVAWRLLAPLLVVALLLTAEAAVSPQTVAAGGSESVASIRVRQVRAEAAMRRADSQIKKLQQLRQHHKRLLKVARKQLDRAVIKRDKARQRAKPAHKRLDALELRLKRKTQVRPDPKGRQAVQAPKLSKAVRQQRQRVKQLDKTWRRAQAKVDAKRRQVQSRKHKPTKARIAKRKAERERAEDRLAAAITAMLSVSKSRAGRLGPASSKVFRKPVAGRISQPFGCTGYWANPRRGSCRHFHDGLDIAAPVGTTVRAAAAGYVAYVGFNPWDSGRRSFVVIIAHSRGYETVYAHLQPWRKVRTGSRVERGERIGRVGMTGTTTGPHVHWEVHQDGTTVNPRKAG